MSISRDNPIIKEIGRKLSKSLTDNEINFLTQTLDETEELLFVSVGFLKKSYLIHKDAKLRMDVPVWSTKKYVALTNKRVIGFDEEQILAERIENIDLTEFDADFARATSLIFLTTEDLGFILLGAPHLEALKIFERLRKVLSLRHREHEMKEVVFFGTWNREDVKNMFLEEVAKVQGLGDAGDYEQSIAHINEIFSPPKHHGA
jgi:hypothetical protein